MAGEIINRLNVGQVVNVKLTDSAVTNGQNLVDAYNYAATLTPNGQARSATNRVALILMPGNYILSEELIIDNEFIDIIGLGAQKLERGSIPAVNILGDSIDGGVLVTVFANNIRIQGLNIDSTYAMVIFDNKPLQVFEDCAGGDNFASCAGDDILSGTFINCTGGLTSFSVGPFGLVTGTFQNCVGGDYSFGSNVEVTVSGVFQNCLGGDYSFGNDIDSTVSGTFQNCVGGDYSFGAGAEVSGTFQNCVGGDLSFGTLDGFASGVFQNCIGALACFGYGGTASGTFTNCTSGSDSFGSYDGTDGTASGTFQNCVGGINSFGGNGGTLSGKLYNCRLTSGTFRSLSSGGIMRNCVDGNNDIIDGQA